MHVVINQLSPLPVSSFLSLCLLFPPPYTRTSNQFAYMQTCMVCMFACVHIGVHFWQHGVSLQSSNTDGNPFVWVCWMETPRMGLSRVILLPTESQLRPGRPLEQVSHLSGCTRVRIYACTYMGKFVCVCVGVDRVKLYG